MYSWDYLDINETLRKGKNVEIIFSAELEKVPPFVLSSLHFNIYKPLQISTVQMEGMVSTKSGR